MKPREDYYGVRRRCGRPDPEPDLTNAIKEKYTELGVLIDQL